MEVRELGLPGVLLIEPKKHSDARGFFSEVYNRREFEKAGIGDVFVQENHSASATIGTIRGLHYQVAPHAAAKLIRVLRGSILDVVVDIRRGSKTFGQHIVAELSAENWCQVYVPIGCAHGFCTLEPDTEVNYKVTDFWHRAAERGLLWNDPVLGIEWPVSAEDAVVSERDRGLPHLFDIDAHF